MWDFGFNQIYENIQKDKKSLHHREDPPKKGGIALPFKIHLSQRERILKPFFRWLYSKRSVGLFLGFRKCGKTQLITIYGVAKWIYQNPQRTVIIMTRKNDRAQAIIRKIGFLLKEAGLKGSFGSEQIRLTQAKQPTVLALTVGSSTKGWHADLLILDDPHEPLDEYSTLLKNRVTTVYNEVRNIATRVFVIGQFVAQDDLYTKLLKDPNVKSMQFWVGDAPEALVKRLKLPLAELSLDKPFYGKNYEGVFYPNENTPFSEILTGDYSQTPYDYGLLDPSNGKNDYSAIVYMKDYGEFVAVKGRMIKKDWLQALQKEKSQIEKLKRFYWEQNCIGASGYYYFKQHFPTLKNYRFTTTENKVEKILRLLLPIKSHKIRLDENSDPEFIKNVKNYSPKRAQNQVDDGIDALAMLYLRLF
jgi:hypothetical protein